MRWTVVGCSGSYPGPEAPASCYLLQATGPDPVTSEPREWNIALDLGNGALGFLQRHTDPGRLDAIVLSHLHADHCLDMCGLYVYSKYHPAQRFSRIPVYGPTDTAARLAAAYGLSDEPGMAEQFEFKTLTAGISFTVGPVTLEPQPALHPVEAFGFRITGPSTQSGTAVIAYSGDTDDCQGLRTIAQDADLLVAEAAFVEGRDAERGIHLTGRRAGQVAAESSATQLLLTHIPAWNDPDVAQREATEVYDGQITRATTGLTLEV